MQIHELKVQKKESKKRIGRGGKRGTFSGKGNKGQKSRAGHRIRPQIREILKRMPKLRGFNFKSIAAKPSVINIGFLNNVFNNGEKISPEILFNKGLISKIKNRMPSVKILSEGDLMKKLIIEKCSVSENAKKKILKVGGQIL